MSLFPSLLLLTLAAAPADDLTPKNCRSCADWNQPQAPFQIADNTWYVGTRGLSVLLVKTEDGLVLLDGALPESVPLIQANIEALGFKLSDIEVILNSHAHFDHAGGIAALARLSGAQVWASDASAKALRAGTASANDPQAGFGAAANAFPPVKKAVGLGDTDVASVGKVDFDVIPTPGHTDGSTSYAWKSCRDDHCVHLVYADSLNAVSAEGFRFSDAPAEVDAFKRAIARVGALRCDVLVSVHPEFSGLLERAERVGGLERFVDPNACRDYADAGAERLNRRLLDEASGGQASARP